MFDLSYLGYFSLISNLNNTKLVERSDWTYLCSALWYKLFQLEKL